MTLDKFFDDINEADLRQLIGTTVAGCMTVEYRECLPDETSEGKKEFLAEVSSFANTAGGHLLYGVKEQNGVLVGLPGITAQDPEREIFRLEKLLKDHLQPQCPGIIIRAVEMSSTGPVLIIRIPESWSKPHVVDFQGHWRFYARNSNGKYPLSVTELKSACLSTAGLGERIRSFHLERLTRISSAAAPVPLLGKARTVYHLVPYSAFDATPPISFTGIQDIWSTPLMYSGTSSYNYNRDGLVVYNENANGTCSDGYTQVFRNGIIESVSANLLGSDIEDPFIPNRTVERDLIGFLDGCLAFYKKLHVGLPAVFLVSLLGVRDCRLAPNRHLNAWPNNVNRTDRDWLLLPEVIVEDLAVHAATVLKPVFNAISRSMGWEKIYGYAEAEEKALFFPSGNLAAEQVAIAQAVKAKGPYLQPKQSRPEIPL